MNSEVKMNKILAVLIMWSLLGLTQAFGAVPVVKIKVAEYSANSFEFRMPEGGTWELGSKTGEIKPATVYRFDGELIAKAHRRFHVVIGSAAYDDLHSMVQIERTNSHLMSYRLNIGVAPLPDMPDNRLVFIAVGSYDTEDEAKAEQDRLALTGISSWIHPENIRSAKGKLTLSTNGKVVADGFTTYQLKSKRGVVLRNVEYAKGFSWSGAEDRTYSDTIWVRWGFNDALECIEHINLEKLLVGIVPSEISASAPTGALQAQAIAARGEMLSKKGVRHFLEGFDFCAEQHCQVYKGILPSYDKITAQIRPTLGQVLLDSKARILDAVYGANCGGHSSANHKIWTSQPNEHLQGVSDVITPGYNFDLTKEKAVQDFIDNPPPCWCGNKKAEGSGKFRWRTNITAKDFTQIEKELNIGEITSINTLERDVSGRIVALEIKGTKGTKRILKELPIRRLFGVKGVLKSSCFVAKWQKNAKGQIISGSLSGAGWGHGVGMCQTGAQSQALEGWSYAKILAHYFPKSKLTKLY
jgi:stage II sporulation protein D